MENQKLAYIYALLSVMFWSTVASAFKITLRYLDFLNLVFYASIVSIITLFVILCVQRKLNLFKEYKKSDYLQSALLGFLNPFLYYAILFKAYSILPAQEAQSLNYLWAITLTLLSIPILKQKISLMSIFAIFISFIGVIVIATHGNILSLRFTNPLGVTLALSSTVVWSLFWIYNVKDKRDDIVKLFLNFLFGFLFILITLIVTKKLSIPVYSIGAGGPCDGQLLICGDMLGLFQAFTPKFVKKYANVAEIETNAFEEYIKEVKSGAFPTDDHSYHIKKGKEEEFYEMLREFE